MPVGISYRAMLAAAGSSAAADAYIVNSFAPPVVADFAGVLNSGTEYYRVGGSDSTFDSMFTHTGASLKTMTDSDGNLKWAPHNIAPQSQNFATTWSASNITVTSDNGTDPDGGANGDLLSATAGNGTITQSFTAVAGDYTAAVWLRRVTGTGNIDIAADNGTWSTKSITGSWALYTVEQTLTAGSKTFGIRIVTSGDEIEAFGFHVYRSDLGGMVDNPDRGDSYVPTTTAAVYQARRNHYRWNGSSYVNKGILLESEARTNLATDSNTFNSAAWTVSNDAQVVSGQTNAITGASDAWILKDDNAGGTGYPYISDQVNLSNTTVHTWSVYAKQKDASFIVLADIGYVGNRFTWFNLGTGAVGTSDAAHTARIEEVADGWYRCSITFTTGTSSSGATVRIYVDDADGTSTEAPLDNTTNVYIYGAQLEAGATPSSYIPTSGATVTRAAETLDIPFANMPSLATAFCVQMQGEIRYADDGSSTTSAFYDWYQNSSNNIRASMRTLTTRSGELLLAASGATTQSPGGEDALTPGLAEPYSLAIRRTASAYNTALDGTSETAQTGLSGMPAITSAAFEIGEFTNVHYYNGTVGMIRMWDADIGDTGIESATS